MLRAGELIVVLALILLIVFEYFVSVQEKSQPVVYADQCIELIDAEFDPETLYRIGQYFFMSGIEYNLNCAGLAYAKASKLDAGVLPTLYYQFGRIEFLSGRYAAAISKFNKQLELHGEAVPNVHYMLGLTYGFMAMDWQKPDAWPKAEEGFKQFLEFDPHNPWAHTDLAWILYSQEKFEEMKEVTLHGLTTHDHHAWLLNMHGLALLNLGDPTAALEYFTTAEAAAAKLIPDSWGAAYPGNDPLLYAAGLNEFRSAIANNIKIAEQHVQGVRATDCHRDHVGGELHCHFD